MSLLSVADALARILTLGEPLPPVDTPLAACAGRFAAADVHARRTQPAADLSAMDGWAIRAAELPGPWAIEPGESTPGRLPAAPLASGAALRIFTGAPLPAGADAILVQEDARADAATLTLTGEGPPGAGHHVRRAGEDFADGALLVPAGARLTPQRIALAAIGGHAALPLPRRARVALVSTGDELVAPGAPTPGLALPASNAPMLAALLAGWPVDVIDLGIVRDDLGSIADMFAHAATIADVIVTTGGASVGTHDLVRPALERAGARLDFWRIAMRPGKPLLAGRLGDATVVGLPGNPVSAFVTARLFLLPLVARLTDMSGALAPPERAVLAGALPATGGRAEYVRGSRQPGGVVAVAGQDSAALRMLAGADLLIVRAAGAPAAQAGDAVEVIAIG